MAATPVYLEVGAKKVFACAVDWPGWARAGRSEEDALEVLAAYEPRYRVVVEEAGVRFPASVARSFDVMERLAGTGETDFGAPGQIPTSDRAPLTAAAARREVALLVASWAVFDRVVARSPAELRKGPRGGGRDRDEIVQHLVEAEVSYSRSLGLRGSRPRWDDTAAVSVFRSKVVEVASQALRGTPATKWPPRYGVRRMAWHVLDHAWEIEDKRV